MVNIVQAWICNTFCTLIFISIHFLPSWRHLSQFDWQLETHFPGEIHHIFGLLSHFSLLFVTRLYSFLIYGVFFFSIICTSLDIYTANYQSSSFTYFLWMKKWIKFYIFILIIQYFFKEHQSTLWSNGKWSKAKLVIKKKKQNHTTQSGDSSAFFHFYLSSLLWLCVLLYEEGWW